MYVLDNIIDGDHILFNDKENARDYIMNHYIENFRNYYGETGMDEMDMVNSICQDFAAIKSDMPYLPEVFELKWAEIWDE